MIASSDYGDIVSWYWRFHKFLNLNDWVEMAKELVWRIIVGIHDVRSECSYGKVCEVS